MFLSKLLKKCGRDLMSNYKDFVTIKQVGDLFIHKYKKQVFYGALWNEHEGIINARGLITDKEGNIVQYPFTKVFNHTEQGVDIPINNIVEAVEKINGFMAAVSWYNRDILVSTTGSIDSDFVEMAKEMLPLDKMKKELETHPNYTYCFEIVHVNDPHIIPEKIGAYLIGARKKILGSTQLSEKLLDRVASRIGVFRPAHEELKFSALLEKIKLCKHEGFMVYDTESNTVLKLKSPYYLVSKFIARTKKLEKIFSRDYKKYLEEEFYSLCDLLQQTYTIKEFLAISEQERLEIIRIWAESGSIFNKGSI